MSTMFKSWSSPKNVFSSGKFVQFVAAFITMIGSICADLHVGWSCSALPKLFQGEAGFEISRSEASWIVGMLTFGGGCGGILAKFLVDSIGRQKTIVLSAIPYFCGWLLIMFSTSGGYLFAAEILAGLSLGVNLVVIAIYLGEISETHLRGTLRSTINFGMNIGCLISYAVGPHFSYRENTYVCIVFPVVFFLAAMWLPESPYYHMMKGNREQAAEALVFLRDSHKKEEIAKELNLIENTVSHDMERRGNIKELFTNEAYRKGLTVAFGLRALQQTTGSMAIMAYLQIIFQDANITMPPYQAAIVYGVVQVCAGILAGLLTDSLGRKLLLFVSFAGVGITMTIMGTYFFVQDYLEYPHEIMATVTWVPISCVLIFCLCYSIGIGSLGFVMLSELFPTNVKSVGVCFGSAFGTFLTFVVVKLYLVIADSVGCYVAFWIFAFFSYFGIIFTHMFVPETKNKNFQEIQDKLNREKPMKTSFEFDNGVVLVAVIKTL